MTQSEKLLSKNQLRWACRRGMLELDLLLGDFFDHCFDELPENEKYVFQNLLSESDQTLLGYFMGHEIPKNRETLNVVEKIRGATTA